MSHGIQAFRVDNRRDQDLASDGVSRYGAYLRQDAARFADLEDLPAEFATAALRVALPPVMSPGYVLTHPRVLDVEPHWDDEGRLAIAVTLVSELPARLAGVCARWAGWRRERSDWFDGAPRWSAPYDNDRRAVLPQVRVLVPVPVDCLPVPRLRHGAPDLNAAKCAVSSIVHVINHDLAPVLDALDGAREAA
ncbi:hypothetical protein F4560_008722 [Saccharothrix ecbatanensis]|uniref:Uncharacterized protein n=1 Tax=Saccharothrix ecbatanensis TaxID=1105145 RepID=A0A7W9HUW7_9PSEU|nr:hypothetical protein [Saccharothrix ecbatanensis]MBB5808954.1 hypothetical protein [Saccharothrix ecbatanensis]